MKPLALGLALILPLAAAPTAYADQMAGMGMDHSAHMTMPAGMTEMPHEGGQAAFAAIHEIVALLEADPMTDWSKVDIEALRQHLIDMDNVTLRAHVRAEEVTGGVRFDVTGSGDTVASIRRMTAAHAMTMNGVNGWHYAVAEIPGGAAMTVNVTNPADVVKVKALSFIGVMALGSHHQMHHLMIATGQNPHH